MFGLLAYRTAGLSPAREIDGVRFRVVSVAQGQGLRARLSAHAAAGKLKREQIRFAIFPPDYPFLPLFAQRGVFPPPLAPLFRAAAPAIVRHFLAQYGVESSRAMVAFAAERVTPELSRCVTTLCKEIRYIALCVPEGGKALASALRREFGVAARIGAPDALPRPDLTVAFDATPVPGNTLRLDETLPVTFDSSHSNELLALLHRAGALDIAALKVKTIAEKTV